MERVTGDLWIVVPVFFDVPSFLTLHSEVVTSIASFLNEEALSIKFVVVDDSAGTDPEIEKLSALPEVSVVTPPFNLGHQRAIVHGLRSLAVRLNETDIVVTMDGDGEDRPEDVVRLVRRLKCLSTNSVVFAERTNRQETLKFKLFYRLFRAMFRLMTGVSIRTGNFAAQWGSFICKTIGHPSFDLCFSTTLLSFRRPMDMVPCSRGSRYEGKSRMNLHRLVAHGIRMLLPFAERIAVRMLVISVGFLATGLSSLAVMLGLFFVGVVSPGSLVVASSCVLIGVVTLSGFLALFAGFAQSSAIALKGLDATGL